MRYPWITPAFTLLGKVWFDFSSLSSLSSLVSLSRPVYGSRSFTPKSFIASQKIKVFTWNFQDKIFIVRQGHPLHQGWACPPCVHSGALNVLQVPRWRTPLLETLIIKTASWNFQGIFLWVWHGHPQNQGWPCPPSVRSGTLNVLQVKGRSHCIPSVLARHLWAD